MQNSKQKTDEAIIRSFLSYYSQQEPVKYFYLFHTIFAVLYKFRL